METTLMLAGKSMLLDKAQKSKELKAALTCKIFAPRPVRGLLKAFNLYETGKRVEAKAAFNDANNWLYDNCLYHGIERNHLMRISPDNKYLINYHYLRAIDSHQMAHIVNMTLEVMDSSTSIAKSINAIYGNQEGLVERMEYRKNDYVKFSTIFGNYSDEVKSLFDEFISGLNTRKEIFARAL